MGLSDFVNIQQNTDYLAVTSRKETAKEVKRKANTTRLQAIFEAAIDGIVIINQRGTIEMVNPAAAKLFGYDQETLIGQNVNILIPPPDKELHDGYLENYLSTGEGKIIGIGREVTGLRKDGSIFPFRLSISEVNLTNERLFTGIVHDLTNEKEAEAKLKLYAKELERSNRDLQDFAYISSHDLQEPLRKIQAFGTRIQKKELEMLSPQGRDYLQRMLNAAQRMRKLIDDLLNFSRVSTRANPFVPTDLNEIVWDVLSDLEITIQETNAEFYLTSLPTIEADPTQMRQLIQNLITNSLKFKRKDIPPIIHISGTYKIDHFSPNKDTSIIDKSDAIEITLKDNGIGFEQKYVDKIFQVFQRLEGRKYEGSGIGLAICKRIVNRHRGEISAVGRLGEGATFTILLPVKQYKDYSPEKDIPS